MTGRKTEKREVESIIECAGELACDNLLIITWDQEGIIEKDGHTIQILPYYKWCDIFAKVSVSSGLVG